MATTPEDLLRLRNEGLLTKEEYFAALDELEGQEERPVPRSYAPPRPVKRVPMDPEKIKRRIVFSIVLLGIFSVLTGLGLIIADRWDKIPDIIKVAGGLALLCSSLIATWRFHQFKKPLWMEAFLFVSFMLVGGNIALIRQIYAIWPSLPQCSMIWWAVSLPLIFFTRYKLLPICSTALLAYALWDYVWGLHYMIVAGAAFIVMMLTHFAKGSLSKFIRELAFIIGIFSLYVGDIKLTSGWSILGIGITTVFLVLMLSTPKTEDGAVRYYNYLFLLVAARVFLLFCRISHGLMSAGIGLVVFGVILLTGAFLYTYYFKQIQNVIRGFVKDEQD